MGALMTHATKWASPDTRQKISYGRMHEGVVKIKCCTARTMYSALPLSAPCIDVQSTLDGAIEFRQPLFIVITNYR